jgi:hypothetical protein
MQVFEDLKSGWGDVIGIYDQDIGLRFKMFRLTSWVILRCVQEKMDNSCSQVQEKTDNTCSQVQEKPDNSCIQVQEKPDNYCIIAYAKA